MIKVTVFYDYVCPYCLLAKVPFDEAAKNKEVDISYIPFELIPEPQPRIDIYHDEKRRKDWEAIILPTSEKLGIGMRLPHVIPRPYTRMAIEGSYFAREHGKEKEYHSRIFKAFFVEEQDIGDLSVLVQLAEEIGLDGKQYKEALLDRRYSDCRVKDVDYARNVAKVTSIPTYVIGEEVVKEVYSKEQFEQILSRQNKE